MREPLFFIRAYKQLTLSPKLRTAPPLLLAREAINFLFLGKALVHPSSLLDLIRTALSGLTSVTAWEYQCFSRGIELQRSIASGPWGTVPLLKNPRCSDRASR